MTIGDTRVPLHYHFFARELPDGAKCTAVLSRFHNLRLIMYKK